MDCCVNELSAFAAWIRRENRSREFSFEQGVVATGIGKYTHMLADNANEREFGDYSPGRWAWILSAVKCFEQPVPAKGALGIWEWTR